MRILLNSLLLLLMVSIGVGTRAQYSLDGRSTKAELKQIRQAVERYIDSLPDHFYRSSDIEWDSTEVVRMDIDDKPGLEAQVHISGEGLCGMTACDNAIVVWRNGHAQVIAIINDSTLSVGRMKSHGLYDLLGHYYSYRWNGKEYDPYCEKGSDTVCDRERLFKHK